MKTPLRAPSLRELMDAVPPSRFVQLLSNGGVKPTLNGRYRHWDSLRHLEPPADMTAEEWWLAIKFARRQLFQDLPLSDRHGNPFVVAVPGPLLHMLRQVDRDTSGQIAISEQVTNPDTRNRYVVSSLMEEAIRSSQLEGANTSRRVAKEMIRTGREPRDKSEQMILNNYRAMNFVREHSSDELTPELVLQLHHIVTVGTMDDPDAAGRLQREGDDRVQVFDELGAVLHTPPHAKELPERMERMCEFANAAADGGDEYVHPVLRAIILHFWLGHDHPFEDGNGRTARALFYWSMLRQGYWLTEFLTISSILKKGPAKYARSFLYSEQDENDLTYFVLFQVDVIVRAVDLLKEYLRRKMREVRETEGLLRELSLNHRQLALLGNALRNPGATYTFQSHATSHGVVYQSARNDLLDLVSRGFLDKRRVGRKFIFTPVRGLSAKITKHSDEF